MNDNHQAGKADRAQKIKIQLADPKTIVDWSHGAILKSETINYRTGRPEKYGLFDERVFGPSKNYQCYCGKYKGARFKGVVCEKCEVEITKSIVRRERYGHIKLETPVAHIWFLKGTSSKMSAILGVPATKLERVIYFAGYIITEVFEDERNAVLKDLENEYKHKMKTLKDEDEQTKLKERFLITKKELLSIKKYEIINEVQYNRFSLRYPTVFKAEIGAEAIYNLFKEIDLEKELENLLEQYKNTTTEAGRAKLEKRISVYRMLIRSNTRPEHMFLTTLAVIPPDMRPLMTLETGVQVSSDLNDLYKRIINRNNRLKKLKDLGAPEVIVRNEKRILQEAVDALLDNSIATISNSNAMSRNNRRSLKSLAENLKGKHGLLRHNQLGKRVDYSGRSVIVIGPELKIDECGLPKYMALELFKPFIISKLIEREYAYNIRGANKIIDRREDIVWEILEEVIQGKYVLLNRAPTLHKLSMQAFKPKLVEGKAIRIHPLVCSGFNADFDGDQMAVHLPLSEMAQRESRYIISSRANLLVPKDGGPGVAPKQDIILGCYWLTAVGEGEEERSEKDLKAFSSPKDALNAYDFGIIGIRERIMVLPAQKEKYGKFNGEVFETTVGRILFNTALPRDFEYINETLTGKELKSITSDIISRYGFNRAADILDDIKSLGFKYVTLSGSTMGSDDFLVPEGKNEIIEEAEKAEAKVWEQFNAGIISSLERYREIIKIWEVATAKMQDLVAETSLKKSRSTHDMIVSKARGSLSQLNQMCGMKGVIRNVTGHLLEYPIKSSYKEGFAPLEYFFSATTARKGLADKALKTADAGYLSRKLHEAGHDVVVVNEDCGTKEYLVKSKKELGKIEIFENEVYGTVIAENVKDSAGNLICQKGDLVDRGLMKKLVNSDVDEVKVRTPLTCDNVRGVCRMCYGMDMSRRALVKTGVAVGTIAAQSIGEPGTQLTMNVIHLGGVAGEDITSGLPRVTEILELRKPKSLAVLAKHDGRIESIEKMENGYTVIKILSKVEDKKKKGEIVEKLVSYNILPSRKIKEEIKEGVEVKKGDMLTNGTIDAGELYELKGRRAVERYMVNEIRRVYAMNNVNLIPKHFEIILRKMFSRRKIVSAGDTLFAVGEIVEYAELLAENERVAKGGGKEAVGVEVFLGITNTALTSASWLAASSFQYTTRIIVNSALAGKEDKLHGLKENIIMGNLIPAGTGFRDDYIDEMEKIMEE